MASTYALPPNGSATCTTHGADRSSVDRTSIASDATSQSYYSAANTAGPRSSISSAPNGRLQAPSSYGIPTSNTLPLPNAHAHSLSHSRSQLPIERHDDHSQSHSLRQYRSASNLHPHQSGAAHPSNMEIDDKQEALAMDNDRIASFDAFAFPPAPGRGRSATVTAGLGLAKRKNWVTRDELFTALLLPLPFLLVSYLFSPRSIFDREDVGDAGSPLDRTVLLPSQSSSGLPSAGLLEACAFTSAILLAVGILSKSGATKEFISTGGSTGGGGLGGKRDEKRYWPQMFSIQGGRRLAHRALSLVLPIYATMVLGGARVSMVLLCVVASSPIEGSPRHGAEGQTWKLLFSDHKATLAAVLLALGCDVLGIIAPIGPGALFVGYTSLALSASVIPLPFTKSFPASTLSTKSPSTSATSAVSSTPWEQQAPTLPLPVKNSNFSPARSIDDVDFTLVAGGILAGPSLIICIISEDCAITASFSQFCLLSSVVASAVLMLLFVQPSTLRSDNKSGLLVGLVFVTLISTLSSSSWLGAVAQAIIATFLFIAVLFDKGPFNPLAFLTGKRHRDHHHENDHGPGHSHIHDHDHASHGHHSKPVKASHSRLTEFLLQNTHSWPILHSILTEKDSRRICYFMCLNFAFMMVQTFYGIVTGSLGLLSDSIHMLFDCMALGVGLGAAVVSKWPPSMRFPYGLGKIDTLAGFANGIFLMLISIEIITEAIERLFNGSEMKRLGELLTISSLGLVVNLVGIMAFDHAHHGHGHSHGGHSHGGHSHDDSHGHGPSSHTDGASDRPEHSHHHHHDEHKHSDGHHTHDHPESHDHGGSHHGHHHSHTNDNMHGIFLHILADALGSVAVIISTILIHYFSWPGFDPLASCIIAVLIFASAIPLVISSAKTLLLTIPADTEYQLRDTLAGVSSLRGVTGYCVPRFWLEDGHAGGVLGVMHVGVARMADTEDVRERVTSFLKSKRANVVVQIERDGEGRCWCGGAGGAALRTS